MAANNSIQKLRDLATDLAFKIQRRDWLEREGPEESLGDLKWLRIEIIEQRCTLRDTAASAAREFPSAAREIVEMRDSLYDAMDYPGRLGERVTKARAGLEVAGYQAAGNEAQNDAPVFLGNGRYQIGPDVICLDGQQANVLQALVELRGATLAQLKQHSGVGNPSFVLSAICDRYPRLKPHISLPGGKGKGGYSTSIIDGQDK